MDELKDFECCDEKMPDEILEKNIEDPVEESADSDNPEDVDVYALLNEIKGESDIPFSSDVEESTHPLLLITLNDDQKIDINQLLQFSSQRYDTNDFK